MLVEEPAGSAGSRPVQAAVAQGPGYADEHGVAPFPGVQDSGDWTDRLSALLGQLGKAPEQ